MLGLSISASGAWRAVGWLMLVLLAAYVFRYLVLFLMGLCALVVCWFVYTVIGVRLKNDELNSMSAAEKRTYYAQDFHFFTVRTSVASSISNREESREMEDLTTDDLTTKDISDDLLRHLHEGARREYNYKLGALVVHSGLPQLSPTYDGSITFHVHSSWSGLFPQSPRLNAMINAQFGFYTAFQTTIDRALAGAMTLPVVSFHMPTGEIASLNFGQKDDAMVLSYAYEALCERFPKAKIVIYAECLGGLRVMNWLGALPNDLSTSPMKQLKGLILESPLPSMEQMISVTRSRRINRWFYRIFCLLMPNFNAELDRYNRYATRTAEQFPNIPMLVGVLKSDWISGPAHLPLWTSRFPSQRSIIIDDSPNTSQTPRKLLRNGQLYRSMAFQIEARNFCTTVGKGRIDQLSSPLISDVGKEA
jgi:hypothetical protein